jgi:hypothetical protein
LCLSGFNILFFDSEQVFYLQYDILSFLSDVHGTTNTIQELVLADIQDHDNLATCKALGLIAKLITGPLWRLIETKGSILDMNQRYNQLLEFLMAGQTDASAFMNADSTPFEMALVKKDAVYERLMLQDSYDPKVYVTLQLIFSVWANYLVKAVRDQLPGGVYDNLDPNTVKKLQGTPKHNKFCERVFGILDHLVKYRPNASTLANESFVMFSLNNTSQWLERKPGAEREQLLVTCRKLGSDMRENYKSRKNEIHNMVKERLRGKQEEIARKRQKVIDEKEKLTSGIIDLACVKMKPR